MADIRPFAAIRPAEGYADKIAALPYDVYDRKEAKAEVALHPDSFLRIDRAETQFDDSVDMYADCVYEKAKELLWGMVSEGKFVRDEAPHYYIYELVMDGRSQAGIVACASVEDYENNVIKRHENTRAEKEQDRIRHVDTCNAQTGPIFLAYRHRPELDAILHAEMMETPAVDFVAPDGITHRVWVIKDRERTEEIGRIFVGIGEIYIADGHHRAASAVRVGKKRMEANGRETEASHFLSVLFADTQLKIMDYNRVVMDLNGYTPEDFLDEIQTYYEITDRSITEIRPTKKGEVSMYLDKNWYLLNLHEKYRMSDPVEGLDVQRLQDLVLGPLLGILDPKTDARIDFVGGIRGLKELQKRCEEGAAVAFAMFPTSMEELFTVADAGRLMPPKSTWFEPKLRSGLFIHEI